MDLDEYDVFFFANGATVIDLTRPVGTPVWT